MLTGSGGFPHELSDRLLLPVYDHWDEGQFQIAVDRLKEQLESSHLFV